MPVLIDGNNLQHAAFDEQPERPVGRVKLCQILGVWARRFGERVSVVFDGPVPDGGLLQQFGDSHVTVTFSGSGVSADSVIGALIAADSAPRRLIVVSTDREVARAAKRREATSTRSDEFWQLVLSDLQKPQRSADEPPEKRRGLAGDQADEWLRAMGFDVNPADDEDPQAFR